MPYASTVVTILGGIGSRAELLDAGCSGGDITRDVRLGRLRRIRRGHYAVRGAPPDAVVAVRVGGVLAGPSAARSYGIWAGERDGLVHVGVPRNASRLRLDREPYLKADRYEPQVVLHWVEGISRRGWRVDFPTCLRQMVEWSDHETAVACLDTAITASSHAEVAAAFEGCGSRERVIVSQAREGSGSGLESIVRQRLESRGHRIQQQVRVRGLGNVDMLVDGRLFLELDGQEFHWTPEAFERDRARDAALAVADRRHLRLTYRRVIDAWPAAYSSIQEVLGLQ